MSDNRIDRIDDSGNIREHALSPEDASKTLCGLTIHNSQVPCGNRTCKRCEQISQQRRPAAVRTAQGEAGPPSGVSC